MPDRKLTDLEEANLSLHGRDFVERRKALEGAKALIKETMETVTVTPPSLSPEEKYAEDCLTSQLEEGMELMATEAKDALALDPNNETAYRQILQYQQWKRTKNKSGLVITNNQKCKGQRNTGVWQRTRDFGWLLKVSGKGNVVGDIVNVRRKGGETIPMELTVEVAPNYFRAREV